MKGRINGGLLLFTARLLSVAPLPTVNVLCGNKRSSSCPEKTTLSTTESIQQILQGLLRMTAYHGSDASLRGPGRGKKRTLDVAGPRVSGQAACERQDRKAPVHLQTQSDDPIGCYGKSMARTTEIAYPLISLVRSTGFPWQLIGSTGESESGADRGLKTTQIGV